MQHIVPYTPRKNGVAERKNHTLKEMANCMLQSKGLSLCFWAQAINCVNYIVNRTPTKALKNITLEEEWSSIKLDVSQFCVFGSEAWVHIPNAKHKALEPKSEKCIFVGYFKDVKGYRLLQPNSKEIIIRRDVQFNENILACEPTLTYVPSSTCKPDLAVVSFSSSLLNNTPSDISSDTDSDDEHPPLPVSSPAPAPPTTSQLPQWVRYTRESVGDLVGDPTDQRRTRFQLQRASSLFAQVSENYDPDTFVESLGHPAWDAAMKEEYKSLLANDTWDLVPLPKGRKPIRCK
jgi:hypothetical protein